MFKLGWGKAEESEIKLPTFARSQRKQGNQRKTYTSVSLTTLKPLTVWIIVNCGTLLDRWEYQTTLPVSWETCMQIKKQETEPCIWNNWFRIEKRVQQGCLLSPCLFNLYAEHITGNAGLGELQLRIKIAGKNFASSTYLRLQMIPL